MRFILRIFFIILLILKNAGAQQFYRAEGLTLFNRGEYRAAITSISSWADSHTSERGIAYYYIGECYYNLGMDATTPSQSISHFRESSRYFDMASKQTDLTTLYRSKLDEVRYKNAWSAYRLAELETNPISSLESASRSFSELYSISNDSIAIYALYMVGESQLRIGEWMRIQMALSPNVGQEVRLAQEVVTHLQEAENVFKKIIDSDVPFKHLSNCSEIRYRDVFFERGKLYQTLSSETFSQLQDPKKADTSEKTAIQLFTQADYQAVLRSMDRLSKATFEPLVIYSMAVKYINLYLLTGDDQEKQFFNSYLDSIQWIGLQEEKVFLQANRDHRSPIDDELFIRLTNDRISDYAEAAKTYFEAWYWLGWVQFVANVEESGNQFSRFIRETENRTVDPRIAVLREDARYRLFLLQFDQHASDKDILGKLKNEIEAFRPQFYFIQEKVELLLQLVRVGLGEPIWGQILQAPTTEVRLRDAFILIRNMLIRATRVTGEERDTYLKYMDQLFQITQDRQIEATNFYRGLSQFLKAEIQETTENKKSFYLLAGDFLERSEGDYQFEGMYVQARSYFAAAKHESNTNQRNKAYERAKPIFIKLINDKRSLRSVYYLGEILRMQGNDLAARQCYDIVIEKTKDQEDGSFWYNNALAAKQSCTNTGDLTALNTINIRDVLFPEKLLVMEGEEISLEKFADPDYIRKQYWEEALGMLMKYGLPKRSIYPSAFALQNSRFGERNFQLVTADIHERIGSVTSGLQLQVLLPEGVSGEVQVSLDGVPLSKDNQGFYQKRSLQMNQLVEIYIENQSCYPVVRRHRFIEPGIERMVVSLSPRIVFEHKGEGLEAGLELLRFPQRLDNNSIFFSTALPLSQSTFHHKDFQSNIHYRDFAYSDLLDGYLVIDSETKNLLFYQNDPLVSKGEEFALVYPDDVNPISSPEGLAIDSQRNIYIADWASHQIFVFRRDGSFDHAMGSFGFNVPANIGKAIHLVFPTKIAILEDTEGILVEGQKVFRTPLIFVADREGIHLMDVDGIYLDTIVSSLSGNDVLYSLTVRGYGENTRLYVLNRNTGKVERFVSKPFRTE
ncbi:hypothetical protein MUP95_06455 [bacterium]|nr:hypothetical protein [bacterium]